MTKKIGDKKIGKVTSTEEASDVERTGSVSGVGSVQATKGVGGVGGVDGIGKRRGTRVMTAAERKQLFDMINEEADKMFGPEGVPASQKEIIKKAVKMAVESGAIDEDEK